jgi:hypothetical protein
MNSSADAKRQMLRHTVATIAYRGGKAVRNAPQGFATFGIGETTRTPEKILAHLGDLLTGHYRWRKESTFGATPRRCRGIKKWSVSS